MRRRHRVLVSGGVVGASIALVLGLVFLGSASQGPLGAILGLFGGQVSRLEARLVQQARGPGRAASLAWLPPLASSREALRDPPRILLGAYDDDIPATLDGVLALERATGASFPLIHLYTAWGDRPDQRFPGRVMQAIVALGSIPVVTWEPWLVDFENRLHPHLPLRDDRDRGGMAAIAAGDYDAYVDAWAREAARFGRPFFLRFGHEMNDPYRYPWGPHNNRPEDFVAAWRHVVERFEAAGATQVLWVWSPHLAYEGWEWYWPGEDVVDWIATGVLNYGTVANWSRWWSFEDIFGRHYEAVEAFGKPIMIAEFGSLAVGGDRAEWYREALQDLPRRHPGVRALLFFHVGADRTLTYQALDWSFLEDPEGLAAIRDALAGWPPST